VQTGPNAETLDSGSHGEQIFERRHHHELDTHRVRNLGVGCTKACVAVSLKVEAFDEAPVVAVAAAIWANVSSPLAMNIDFDDIDDFVRRAEEVCDELGVLGT